WIGFSDTIRTDYPFLRWLAVLYLIVLVLRWRSLWRPSLVLILGIGIYLFAYILSPHNIEWHVNTSITRLTLQFIPSFVFLTVISLCFHKQGVKTKSKIG
ncbi:MAG: hypothetical protein JST52_09070, partial [Bacteroidetes bacterium]|nr:hypothetical protein [Bacteroidota bacterium]